MDFIIKQLLRGNLWYTNKGFESNPYVVYHTLNTKLPMLECLDAYTKKITYHLRPLLRDIIMRKTYNWSYDPNEYLYFLRDERRILATYNEDGIFENIGSERSQLIIYAVNAYIQDDMPRIETWRDFCRWVECNHYHVPDMYAFWGDNANINEEYTLLQ